MTYLAQKPATGQGLSVPERPLITIEFAPDIHPDETEYEYFHPLFTYGSRVTLTDSYPATEYKVCAIELIESKTPSGRLLNQPRWKYKISDGETSYWKEETAILRKDPSSSNQTCSNCSYFQDYQEPNGRGWCQCFNRQAKRHHQMTNDCILNGSLEKTEELEEALRPHSDYQVGSIVKIIDPDEHHTEWATFEVAECRYNNKLYRSTESYLNETEWYYKLISLDGTYCFGSVWVSEDEICPVELAHNVCCQEVF